MGILPRRNPFALFAYYLGVFALVPVVGLALGPLAVVLGVFGVRAARRKPDVKGGGHAWAGVVMGAVGIIVSAVGTWVCVPMQRLTRPSTKCPMAIVSLVASA